MNGPIGRDEGCGQELFAIYGKRAADRKIQFLITNS